MSWADLALKLSWEVSKRLVAQAWILLSQCIVPILWDLVLIVTDLLGTQESALFIADRLKEGSASSYVFCCKLYKLYEQGFESFKKNFEYRGPRLVHIVSDMEIFLSHGNSLLTFTFLI